MQTKIFLNCSWKDRKSTETVGFKITVSEQQQIFSSKEINAQAAGTVFSVIILLSAILCGYPPPPRGKCHVNMSPAEIDGIPKNRRRASHHHMCYNNNIHVPISMKNWLPSLNLNRDPFGFIKPWVFSTGSLSIMLVLAKPWHLKSCR